MQDPFDSDRLAPIGCKIGSEPAPIGSEPAAPPPPQDRRLPPLRARPLLPPPHPSPVLASQLRRWRPLRPLCQRRRLRRLLPPARERGELEEQRRFARRRRGRRRSGRHCRRRRRRRSPWQRSLTRPRQCHAPPGLRCLHLHHRQRTAHRLPAFLRLAVLARWRGCQQPAQHLLLRRRPAAALNGFWQHCLR